MQISTLSFGIAVTSTNVVVPQIRGTLSLTHEEGAWIVTLFLVAAAVATPLTGWLAGKLGWRRFMVIALAGFTLSTLACGLADSLEALLLARVAQGMFSAPMMPMGQGMLLATFPRRMHPLVLMLWGTGAVMGPTLGPILGGVMAESFNWRWAFLSMVPIGALTTALAAFALGDQEQRDNILSKPETITIDEVKYVRADSINQKATTFDGLKYIICRTYSAGVFAGYLESRTGQEVGLRKARRLWYWEGAASLSQAATDGFSKPASCKFPCEVDRVELLNAIELLDCTKKAQDSIASVKVWQS